jgi:hypothetical protein
VVYRLRKSSGTFALRFNDGKVNDYTQSPPTSGFITGLQQVRRRVLVQILLVEWRRIQCMEQLAHVVETNLDQGVAVLPPIHGFFWIVSHLRSPGHASAIKAVARILTCAPQLRN